MLRSIAHARMILTLKITVLETHEALTMKLEGKILGPWVSECRQSWKNLQPTLGDKKLSLDLCEVSFVDHDGMALLREICSATHATIIADSPLTKHFAEQAIRPSSENGKKGS